MSLKPVKEIMQSAEGSSMWLSARVYIQLCDNFTMQSKVTDFFIFNIMAFESSCYARC